MGIFIIYIVCQNNNCLRFNTTNRSMQNAATRTRYWITTSVTDSWGCFAEILVKLELVFAMLCIDIICMTCYLPYCLSIIAINIGMLPMYWHRVVNSCGNSSYFVILIHTPPLPSLLWNCNTLLNFTRVSFYVPFPNHRSNTNLPRQNGTTFINTRINEKTEFINLTLYLLQFAKILQLITYPGHSL